MKMTRFAALALAGILATAACSDDGDVDDVTTSVPAETTTTVAGDASGDTSTTAGVTADLSALALEAQTEMNALSDAIEASETPEELESEMQDISSTIEDLVADLAAGETTGIEDRTSALRGEVQEFGRALDRFAEELSPELRTAWDDLRVTLEAIVAGG